MGRFDRHEFRIESEVEVFKSKMFSLFRRTWRRQRLDEKGWIESSILTLEGPPSVVFLGRIVDAKYMQEEHFLLTVNFRPAVVGLTNPFFFEAPAGRVEEKESAKAALLRELGEELPAVTLIEQTAHQVFRGFLSPGIMNEHVTGFVGDVTIDHTKSRFGGLELEGEDVMLFAFTMSQMIEMVNRGEIDDLKTIALIENYRRTHYASEAEVLTRKLNRIPQWIRWIFGSL